MLLELGERRRLRVSFRDFFFACDTDRRRRRDETEEDEDDSLRERLLLAELCSEVLSFPASGGTVLLCPLCEGSASSFASDADITQEDQM